ncbi:MAG: ABC transporter permease [Chloroflexota bacterium]|nr:ABC transporter permease [Chloroflexota bacterium]
MTANRMNERRISNEYGILGAVVALFIFFSLASPFFFDANNLVNLGRQTVLLGVTAFAMTFIILSGEIDLSVGSVVSLISIIVAMTLRDTGSIIGALAVGLGAGALIGVINGLVTVKGHVPSFITTLGIFSAARGISLAVTNSVAIPILNEDYLLVFQDARPLGIAVSVIYAVVLFAALHFVLTRTRFGTSIYAIGGNAMAARLSGIPVDRIKILVFVLAGTIIGFAAILQIARIGSASPEVARNLELDAIAAVVLGGTSLTGGRGSLVRTIFGVLLIGILNNGMNLLNIDSYFQFIIKGAIIILAVLIDRWSRGRGA